MTTTSPTSAERELRTVLGESGVLPGHSRDYLHDATESRGVSGHADAVALPRDAAQVAEVVAWCYAHDVPLVPRGGGTRQWAEPALALHESIKRLLDPKGLLNPGKKLAR